MRSLRTPTAPRTQRRTQRRALLSLARVAQTASVLAESVLEYQQASVGVVAVLVVHSVAANLALVDAIGANGVAACLTKVEVAAVLVDAFGAALRVAFHADHVIATIFERAVVARGRIAFLAKEVRRAVVRTIEAGTLVAVLTAHKRPAVAGLDCAIVARRLTAIRVGLGANEVVAAAGESTAVARELVTDVASDASDFVIMLRTQEREMSGEKRDDSRDGRACENTHVVAVPLVANVTYHNVVLRDTIVAELLIAAVGEALAPRSSEILTLAANPKI